MKTKLVTVCMWIVTAATCLFWVAYLGYPHRLPPDGKVVHIWEITWLTPSNTVWVYNGMPQKFTSHTANPHRNFGPYIKYHWFRRPTFEAPPDPESQGARCVGRMVR